MNRYGCGIFAGLCGCVLLFGSATVCAAEQDAPQSKVKKASVADPVEKAYLTKIKAIEFEYKAKFEKMRLEFVAKMQAPILDLTRQMQLADAQLAKDLMMEAKNSAAFDPVPYLQKDYPPPVKAPLTQYAMAYNTLKTEMAVKINAEKVKYSQVVNALLTRAAKKKGSCSESDLKKLELLKALVAPDSPVAKP